MAGVALAFWMVPEPASAARAALKPFNVNVPLTVKGEGIEGDRAGLEEDDDRLVDFDVLVINPRAAAGVAAVDDQGAEAGQGGNACVHRSEGIGADGGALRAGGDRVGVSDGGSVGQAR